MKAMANWERKSSYLLREIVKFRTYIDCLQAAQVQKEAIYASRTSVPVSTATSVPVLAAEENRPEKGKEYHQPPNEKEVKCTTSAITVG